MAIVLKIYITLFLFISFVFTQCDDFTLGDANNDNVVNVTDVVLSVNAILLPMMASPYQNYASDYNSDQVINIADIVSVTATDRTEGFSISEANGIIIGFSLTGAAISAGDGAIVSVTVQGITWGQADGCLDNIILSSPAGDNMEAFSECGSLSVGGEMIEGCMDMDALNYDPDANVACDDCCQYPADVTLSFGDVSSSSAEILMDNAVDVAGFQFIVSGATITEASGGLAESSGFMVSVGGSTVIGFSLTGATIDMGVGTLVDLAHDGLGGDEICFTDVVISDPGGNPLSVNLG